MRNRTARGRTLLCVDKKRRALKALARQLAPRGIRVAGAADAESAYLACFSHRPDVVLIDADRRGVEYRQVLTQLRRHPFMADVKTIVASRRPIDDLADDAATANVTFLSKPIDADVLVDLLSGGKDTAARETWPAATTETLPASPPAPESQAAKSAEPTSIAPDRLRPRILCVDDDPNVSRALAAQLRPFGLDVIWAFSSAQGYWTGLDVRPDLIIIEMRTPDGDGNHLFRRFQSHPLTEGVPVIVLTSETNPAMRREMLSLGVAAYFLKPWDAQELLAEVAAHVPLVEACRSACTANQ